MSDTIEYTPDLEKRLREAMENALTRDEYEIYNFRLLATNSMPALLAELDRRAERIAKAEAVAQWFRDGKAQERIHELERELAEAKRKLSGDAFRD